jgi:aspartokinase/homoserine dehydrogenase 1
VKDARRLEIHKFGGTSLGAPDRIDRAARRLAIAAADHRVVVVASAMGGVTDMLVAALDTPDTHPADTTIDALRQRHHAAAAALEHAVPPADRAPGDTRDLDDLLDEAHTLLSARALLGERTARTRDRVLSVGEKLSVRLLSRALRRHGADSVVVDADTFLETDGQFGGASPLPGIYEPVAAAALTPHLDAGRVPVVTGFCGRAPDGATTTLGRGGSDYSATLLAFALGADAVTVWTDVDGVYTADPRQVSGARRIPQLNFREAAELSYYGAKVLHPRTLAPVAGARGGRPIPVHIRNSFAEDDAADVEGTTVDGRFTPGSHPVKAISAIGGHALLSIEGSGMAGVPGVAARVFDALAAARISVTMISQSSSEANICLAVPAEDADRAAVALKRAFREDLAHGDLDDIRRTDDVCLVAAVGLGMAHTPGVAGRALQALGDRGVNVLAMAQGSSELNITAAVEHADRGRALEALHVGFGLHRLDTGDDDPDALDLLLVGCGRIGRVLLSLLEARAEGIRSRFGVRPRVVGVADRSGYVLAPTGLGAGQLEVIRRAKAGGAPLAGLPDGVPGDAHAFLTAATRWRLVRPVLVDVTDADGAEALFEAAFAAGCDVVTANKKPLAGADGTWRALAADAAARDRLLRAETTVGAGLPVVDTLEQLRMTGDRVHRVEGCLSGTLGYVMTRLEDGATLSEAVREAVDAGYTEPDPVADLCGADVGRKATILARFAEVAENTPPLTLTGLVDAELLGRGADALWAALAELDGPVSARIAAARARGEVLRYAAVVEPEGIHVGLTEVAADSPLGRLRGTDNLVVFETERYRDRPLVVSGPGAGTEVTAMGVLGDVVRVIAERRR